MDSKNDENDGKDGNDKDPRPIQECQPNETRHSLENQTRPVLPRLTSKSRAPPSDLGSEQDTQNSQQPDRVTDSPGQPPRHHSGPIHLRGSKEIPLHTEKESASTSSPPGNNVSPGPATTACTEDASPESTRRQTLTPAKLSSKSKEDGEESEMEDSKGEAGEGQNPPIQIPKVTPLSSGLTIPPDLAKLAQGLEGKYVDEFGNILDWDGQVLGRAAGDLPSMIGRPVSSTGEILDEDGQVAGYVAENDVARRPSSPPSPQPIQGMGNGLRVDHHGNILDAGGNIVGHFNPEHLARQAGNDQGAGEGAGAASGRRSRAGPSQETRSRSRSRPTAAPSPSEIYLDVKSTNDGVQLIIKIPTVFNGGTSPNIHIGTG